MTSPNIEEGMSAKAISVNAYWAWAIREGHKRVENRTWRTHHRGVLLIHASQSDEHDHDALHFFAGQGIAPPKDAEIAALRGSIIARCELVDCDDFAPLLDADDPWAWGPVCWRLGEVHALPPIPTRGLPGLFHVDVSLDD